MLSQTEAHRLAAAIHALRADWPLASLSTFIRTKLADKAYRDAAVALAWVATDEKTTTPARVLEAGPWWRAAQAGDATVSAITHRCPEHPEHKAASCPECGALAVPAAECATWQRPAPSRRARPARRPDPTPDETRRQALRDQLDAEEAQP
jgi:hypothetical protein